MVFGGIQRTSTLDFPGVLACVVFTLGCDMDCFYCHNRGLISGGPAVEQEQVYDFLRRRQGLLDGVVVSGGEPTLHGGLADFLRMCRQMGYKTKLDTNGGRPRAVAALLEEGLVDYAALDIKARAQDYAAVCGAPGGLAPAGETARLLAKGGIPYECRTTLYPGLGTGGLAEILASLPPQPVWRLNFFRMPQEYKPRDAARLALPALTPAGLEADAPGLLAIQPGLVWGR